MLRGRRRTSNGSALVQVVASTAPEVDGDGALGGGLPCEVDSLASLSIQAGSRDVERVGAVRFASALSESKQGSGGNGQEGGLGETHGDSEC